jgi:hypothetical protein
MQHLLLALSIIILMLITGNGRGKASLENNKVSIEMGKPAINNVDSDLPADKPSIIFSRFEMFVY